MSDWVRALGIDYGTYQDDLSEQAYLDWTRAWVGEVKRVLRDDGALFLNIGASGLRAYSRALSTIGDNIANAQTPGYARRTLALRETAGGTQSALVSRNVSPGGVTIGAAGTYAGVGDEILYVRYGFAVYEIAARRVGATPVEADDRDYATDVDALLEADGLQQAELILGQSSELTRQPWVIGDRPISSLPGWEPEPCRWLGYNAIIRSFVHEDQVLANPHSPAWRRTLAMQVAGFMEGLMR